MNMKKVDKHYVSDIDRQLREFDAKHPPADSQQAEIAKYQRIHKLRDQANLKHANDEEPLWADFQDSE